MQAPATVVKASGYCKGKGSSVQRQVQKPAPYYAHRAFLALGLGWCAVMHACLLAADSKAPSPDAAKLVPLHAASLRETNLEKIQAATEALAATQSPLAAPHLWQLYETGDADRRKLALRALGKLGVADVHGKLFEAALADPLLSIRRAAAEALRDVLGRDDATKRFQDALKPEARVLQPLGRWRCVQSIAHLGGAGALESLIALLDDPDDDVAVAAAEGLGILGDKKAVAALVQRLKTPRAELRPALPDALEQLSGEMYGYNLVQWEEWIQRHAEGPLEIEARAPQPVPAQPGAEDGYAPDYRDPYQKPLGESCIDFVVVFDTTGSLLHIWPEVSSAIDAVMQEMSKTARSLRVGSVRYRADAQTQTLTYLIKPFPLTRDVQKARDSILDATFGGGSGGLHLGIRHAISAFGWRANARKVVLVVGDTTPVEEGLRLCVSTIQEAWAHDRVQFNALYIRSIHGTQHKSTYRLLADVGGGRFYEYNKAWSRLVDLSAEKPDPKRQEMPGETLEKWLTPPPAPAAPPTK